MAVMDIFVMTELDVYHIFIFAMDMHHVLMDLMKKTVVRHSPKHVNTCICILNQLKNVKYL